jgi:ribosomal protein S27AE
MTEKRRTERRKANQVPAKEKRGHAPDRRRCPHCGSSVRTLHESLLGGSVTRHYCSKCKWEESSRQMDVEHVRSLLGFETQVFGTAKKPMLELSPELLKAAGWNLKDTLELKPLYTPGSDKSLSFVLKKI